MTKFTAPSSLSRRRVIKGAGALAAGIAAPGLLRVRSAYADYPDRPVKFVVANTPGGPSDLVARIVAAALEQSTGKTFIVENRGGAGGNIGMEDSAHAEPDGYTLLATQPAPITSNIALYKKLNFDPVALEPVAVMSKFPNVLLVRQDFPAKTVQEFVAHVKANPGKVNMASSGNGTSVHLSGEMFMAMSGAKMQHVPYRGAAPAITDMLGGQVQVIFDNMSSIVQHIRSGSLRALAVTVSNRAAAGAYADASGPLLADLLRDAGCETDGPTVIPDGEAVTEILRRAVPELYVSLSCELAPRLGEYERTATTVVNAYLGPVISRYTDTTSAMLTFDESLTREAADPSIAGMIVNIRDVTHRKALDGLLAEESRILEMIAWGEALEGVLDLAALVARDRAVEDRSLQVHERRRPVLRAGRGLGESVLGLGPRGGVPPGRG